MRDDTCGVKLPHINGCIGREVATPGATRGRTEDDEAGAVREGVWFDAEACVWDVHLLDACAPAHQSYTICGSTLLDVCAPSPAHQSYTMCGSTLLDACAPLPAHQACDMCGSKLLDACAPSLAHQACDMCGPKLLTSRYVLVWTLSSYGTGLRPGMPLRPRRIANPPH